VFRHPPFAYSGAASSRSNPGGEGLSSMKRTFVFMLLGPVLGLFGATLNEVVARGGFRWEFGEGAAMALVFSVIVSAVTAPVDGYFAHALSLPLRVPLTAIVGATIAVGLILALGGKMLPQDVLMRFTITGALAMGTCSLLSHNSRAMWW